jgi:hypothetical protein
LLLCVVVLFILMSAGASTLSVGLMQKAAARRTVEVDQAMAIAEAGIDRAVFELGMGADYGSDGIGNASGTVGMGSFSVTITPAFTGPGTYRVRSTSTVNAVQRALEAVVAPTTNFSSFFGRDALTLSGSGIADSYDSSLGTYASQVSGVHAGEEVCVASNGTIDISGVFMVYGTASPGPGFTVTSPTNVTGSTTPAISPVLPDPYAYSPAVASLGPWSGPGDLGPGVLRYDSFDLAGGGDLTFHGDVELWVDGGFSLSGTAQIVVAPGASLVIHHGTGDLSLAGNGLVNQSAVPSKLQVFSASSTLISVLGTADFHGVVYAPEAAFVANGAASVYGSVIARTIEASGGPGLHYDVALSSVAGEYEVRFVRPVEP